MRTVFTFSACFRDDMQTFLGISLPAAGVPVLGIPHIVSVDFYDDGQLEMPDLVDSIAQYLGAPSLAVVAHISGRVVGTAGATEFCIQILSRFGGVALDDYSDHFWTFADLQARSLFLGHHFFDTKGWFLDRAAPTDNAAQP